MYAGHAFQYVREAPITFCPTYKFDKYIADPFGYDSSEKRRVPAWTDRIFFRGSAFIKNAIEVGLILVITLKPTARQLCIACCRRYQLALYGWFFRVCKTTVCKELTCWHTVTCATGIIIRSRIGFIMYVVRYTNSNQAQQSNKKRRH